MNAATVLQGLKCSSLSAALALTWLPAASAQEGGLEEVVVTARFREERLQDTPIAITAVTAADIQTRAFGTAYEVGYMIPNASLRPAQAAFGNTMTAFIRGIGQNDFDFAFEPGVAIYIDDVYHPFTLASQVELLDLERVEVLRGPQGTLFGRGSIGGAIRYITQKPQGDNTGNIRLTAGNFNRVDVRASYDFAVTDNLFARVAGMSKSREGYQDVVDFACAFPDLAGDLTPQTVNRGSDCKIGTQGGESVVGLRGSLRWVASERFEVTVTADYEDDNSEAKADTLILVDENAGWPSFVNGVEYDRRFLPPDPYVSYATYADPNTDLRVTPQSGLEKTMASVRADWSLSDNVGLSAILSYTDITATLATDADVSPLNLQTVDGIQEADFLTAELRFSGRAWDRMDWTTGVFLYDGESINQQMVNIPFFSLILDGVPPEQTARQPFVNARNVHQNRNESIFGNIVYDFNDRLALNAGVRFSDDEKDVNFDNTRVRNPNVVVADDQFDWRLGLDYRFTESLMAYVSVATGYRPGSYNPRPFQASQVVAVDSEESTAYELGMKSDLLGSRLRFNAALFFTDWETRILPVPGTECILLDLGPPLVYDTVPPGTPGAVTDTLGNTCLATVSRTFYENGPGEILGVELELQYQPTDRWTVGAVYGFTDWDSADINDNPNVLTDRPIYVPEDNWSVSVAYTASTQNGGSWTPRLDLYGQSEICTSTPSLQSTFPGIGCSEGYELLNARIEWASPDREWLVAVGATNVTDEEYFLNRFDLTAFGQPHVEGQPGAPRQWYLTLQRDF